MAGIRVQHPTERDCTFTLVDASRPYAAPWTCPPPPEGCASTHLFKTYHLRLDGACAAIVSREIVERLKRIPGQPFRIVNEVAEPPAQRLSMPALRIPLRALRPGVDQPPRSGLRLFALRLPLRPIRPEVRE